MGQDDLVIDVTFAFCDLVFYFHPRPFIAALPESPHDLVTQKTTTSGASLCQLLLFDFFHLALLLDNLKEARHLQEVDRRSGEG